MLTSSAPGTQPYSLVQVEQPGAKPVDAAYVLALLGFGDELPASEVSLVDTFIPVATMQVESMLGQALISRKYRFQCDTAFYGDSQPWWDGVRDGAISQLYSVPQSVSLPVYPLVSVEAVTIYSEQDDAITVDPAVYYVDTLRKPGRVMVRNGHVWPPVVERVGGSFEIDFTAGYGESASDVPADLRWAVGTVVAYMYDHRGCDASMAINKSGARAVIDQARLVRL